MILFLDDDVNRAAIAYQRSTEERRSKTIWCKTAQEAIQTLQQFELEEAHLDHDLEGPYYMDSRHHNCGMEVVRWLESHAADHTWDKVAFVVHSHNVRAAVKMVERLRASGYDVKYIPFGMTYPLSISATNPRGA